MSRRHAAVHKYARISRGSVKCGVSSRRSMRNSIWVRCGADVLARFRCHRRAVAADTASVSSA